MKNPQDNSLFYCVVYLAPGDYHRFHAPSDCTFIEAKHVAGELLSVSPFIAKLVRNLFVLNERVALVGEWKHGFLSYVPVGATNVGSISINCCPGLVTNLSGARMGVFNALPIVGRNKFSRGDEIGVFRLGSTIVMMFEAPKSFRFLVETNQRVRVGQALGEI